LKADTTHIMRDEIREQPQAIRDTLAAEGERIAQFAARLRAEQIRHVLLVARGTSDNAATYARYLFGVVNGVLVTSVAASLFTVYDAELDLGDTLVLGISQSGTATDVIDVLKRARAMGTLTAAVTNTEDSPIYEAAELALLTRAYKEHSIPATKSYTTALAVLHRLAAQWAQDSEMAAALNSVPALMEQVFELEPQIEDHSERYRFLDTCVLLGRGFNLCTAHEIGLKLGECAQVVPAAHSAADFMHGPIASIQAEVPCLLIAPEGKALGSMLELAMALDERNAEMLTISNEPSLLEIAKVAFELPTGMPEHISPLVAVVVGQLLAYHVAIHKGLDPDRPAGLQKVTRTM